MSTDIRDEFEDNNVGRAGLPILKRTDSWAKSTVKGWAVNSGIRRHQAMFDRQRRQEPSLPKFKCLED